MGTQKCPQNEKKIPVPFGNKLNKNRSCQHFIVTLYKASQSIDVLKSCLQCVIIDK